MTTPCNSAWAASSGGIADTIALKLLRSSISTTTAVWLLASMATRSVTLLANGMAAARSAAAPSQRSTSWTSCVITTLGMCSFPSLDFARRHSLGVLSDGRWRCGRVGGDDAELLHERGDVGEAPVLADTTSLVEPHDVDERHVHSSRRRRHAHELTLMRSRRAHPGHGLVPAGDEVIDVELHVRERSEQAPEELEHALLRRHPRHRVVLDEVVGHQVAEPGDVSRTDPLVRTSHRHGVIHCRPPALGDEGDEADPAL